MINKPHPFKGLNIRISIIILIGGGVYYSGAYIRDLAAAGMPAPSTAAVKDWVPAKSPSSTLNRV